MLQVLWPFDRELLSLDPEVRIIYTVSMVYFPVSRSSSSSMKDERSRLTWLGSGKVCTRRRFASDNADFEGKMELEKR
jgi:hypothetical protein